MSRPLKIQLPDATLLRIDQDEWKVLASPIHLRPRGDMKQVIDQLFVRQHPDGRILVYVVLEPAKGEVVATVAGEVLPTVGSDAESEVANCEAIFDA